MIKYLLILILTIFPVFCVPWFFTGYNTVVIFGLPLWAFYALVATLIYSILIALIIAIYWHHLEK